jgi:predicted nucleic acid-binding protein
MRNRSFDDKKIEFVARERKHNIAILITEEIISTQIADEVSSYFLKKAAFNQEQVKAVIQPLYRRCTMVEFSLNIFESASNLRSRYNFSF